MTLLSINLLGVIGFKGRQALHISKIRKDNCIPNISHTHIAQSSNLCFRQAMKAAVPESDSISVCIPLLAQLARSVAIGCLARILGASCQNRTAKAELLSLHGASLVPLLLRTVSNGARLEGIQAAEAGPQTPSNPSPKPATPTIVHTPEVGEAGAKKSPRRFSLSSMACGFLPNLLSVPGSSKGVASSLSAPGKPKDSLPELTPAGFELVDNCALEGAIHTPVHNPVDTVQTLLPVDNVNSHNSVKLPVIVTGKSASGIKSAKPSPVEETELPETVTAAARCLAFLGYRPFPLWQAAEAPREEAKELEVDDFVVVDLEKETKDVWDQVGATFDWDSVNLIFNFENVCRSCQRMVL